jgi:hypothetical protein
MTVTQTSHKQLKTEMMTPKEMASGIDEPASEIAPISDAELCAQAENATQQESTAAPADRTPPILPFSKWQPLLAGALLGLMFRLIFFVGKPGSNWSAMAMGFVWLVPLAIGAITVYVAERQKRRTMAYYFYAPFLATALAVLGSLLTLVEGMICAILIIPLFALVGMTGGVIMGMICRLTNWPRHAAYSFAVLPLLAALVLPQNHDHQLGTIERSVLIQASPAQVWRQISNIRNITPAEMQHAWAYRIGAPLPISGVTVETPQGRIRQIVWGKGVHFDEVIQQWEPERHVRWTYRFSAESFPAGALDDHVRIGGEYFDLRDTAYTLTQENDATRLHLRISYRISTDFDVYVNWVAQNLLGNFSEVILEMYKARSEDLLSQTNA